MQWKLIGLLNMRWRGQLDKPVLIPAGTKQKQALYLDGSTVPRYHYKVAAHAHLELVIAVISKLSSRIEVLVETEGPHAHIDCTIIGILSNDARTEIIFRDYENHPLSTSIFTQHLMLVDQAHLKSATHISIGTQASGTQAHQYSYILLLNESGFARAAPSLEIERFDVGCKHGAAVGSLHEEEYFYAATRGFSASDLEELIKKNFFIDTLEKVCKDKAVQEALLKKYVSS